MCPLYQCNVLLYQCVFSLEQQVKTSVLQRSGRHFVMYGKLNFKWLWAEPSLLLWRWDNNNNNNNKIRMHTEIFTGQYWENTLYDTQLLDCDSVKIRTVLYWIVTNEVCNLLVSVDQTTDQGKVKKLRGRASVNHVVGHVQFTHTSATLDINARAGAREHLFPSTRSCLNDVMMTQQ